MARVSRAAFVVASGLGAAAGDDDAAWRFDARAQRWARASAGQGNRTGTYIRVYCVCPPEALLQAPTKLCMETQVCGGGFVY